MKIIMSVLVTVVMSLLLSVGWAEQNNCPGEGGNGAAVKSPQQCTLQSIQSEMPDNLKKCLTTNPKKIGEEDESCKFYCCKDSYLIKGKKVIFVPVIGKQTKYTISDCPDYGSNVLGCNLENNNKTYSITIDCYYGQDNSNSSWLGPDEAGKYTCKHNEAQKNN
jgi:hypothetical protein